MRQFLFAKKARSFILTVCIVLCCTLLLFSVTAIKTEAAATDEADSWMDNTQYDIPEHIPQTYSFKSDEFADKVKELILFKGDTLIYEPEPFDAAAWDKVAKGQWLTMFKGFAIYDGNVDYTSKISDINNISSYSGEGKTAYTSITITSDKPLRLDGGGAGPISDDWSEKAWKGKAYRCHYLSVSQIYNSVVSIEYIPEPSNVSDDDARIYGGENDPTEYYWIYEEYDLPAFSGIPVLPGYHFDHWDVVGAQEAHFFTLIDGTNNRFHVKPPVLWDEVRSGWTGTTRFQAAYRSEPDCGTLKLDANGGKIEGLDFRVYEVTLSQTGDKSAITSAFDLKNKTPTHEAESFIGWYTDSECTDKVNSITDIIYNGNAGSANNRKKTLYAGWGTLYSITVAEGDSNGDVSVSLPKAAKGTLITLSAAPKSGYRFARWKVVSGDVTIDNNSFVMPQSDVIIDAVFEPETEAVARGVSCLPSANGSIKADKTSAKRGETVTLTVTPDESHKLKQIQILDGLGQDLCMEIGLSVTDNTFLMPDMNVRIIGVFEKINADGLTDEIASVSGRIEFGDEIPDDCTLDVRPGKLPDSFTAKDGETVRLFEISILRNNTPYAISGNNMTVTIALTDDLLGFDYYRVSYLNDEKQLVETQKATADGDFLRFTTNHLSDYVVEAGENTSRPSGGIYIILSIILLLIIGAAVVVPLYMKKRRKI